MSASCGHIKMNGKRWRNIYTERTSKTSVTVIISGCMSWQYRTFITRYYTTNRSNIFNGDNSEYDYSEMKHTQYAKIYRAKFSFIKSLEITRRGIFLKQPLQKAYKKGKLSRLYVYQAGSLIITTDADCCLQQNLFIVSIILWKEIVHW